MERISKKEWQQQKAGRAETSPAGHRIIARRSCCFLYFRCLRPFRAETELQLEGMWRVVVLNDPVNLMSYVVMVFKKVFNFDEATARRHMLEVHEQGRSVVWSGLKFRF